MLQRLPSRARGSFPLFDNVTAVSVASPGTQHVKGSWVELSPSTPEDLALLHLNLTGVAASLTAVGSTATATSRG